MVALLLALFVAAQSAGQAPARRNDTRTWYQAYADGKRAFDQKNWQAAIDSLEAAKRARAPKPGRRIPFYGDVYDDYLPDYYLGMAYLNLRQFMQADQAFAAVRASGLIGPKDREYAEFQRQTAAVTAGLRESATVAQNNQAPPAGNTPPPVANNPPAASTTPAAAPNPGPVAINTLPANLPTQQLPATQPTVPAGNAGGASSGRQPTSTVPPGPARGGRNSAGSSTITPPIKGPVSPRAEEDAIRAYLSGQYDQAAALLNTSVQGPGATPRAFFYLACSRTALAILGQGSSADVDGAKQLLARAGNPAQFAEDRRYVSPRVLRMLGLNP
jgi:hypothetical protein